MSTVDLLRVRTLIGRLNRGQAEAVYYDPSGPILGVPAVLLEEAIAQIESKRRPSIVHVATFPQIIGLSGWLCTRKGDKIVWAVSTQGGEWRYVASREPEETRQVTVILEANMEEGGYDLKRALPGPNALPGLSGRSALSNGGDRAFSTSLATFLKTHALRFGIEPVQCALCKDPIPTPTQWDHIGILAVCRTCREA
jgi:hypothetical protein